MAVGQPLFPGFGGTTIEPIDRQADANMARLSRKYSTYGPLLAQLPADVGQSLIDVDSDRVARGAPPLTDAQTAKALRSAIDQQPYTPPPERGIGPRSLPGNAVSDLGTIVKSIPRLPFALFDEVKDVASIGDRIAENQAAGMNPIAALLNAPGVRMLPGAYIAGQVTQGPEGLKELARHPLFAALDALPIAGKAAEATRVGQLAKDAELAAGRPAGSSALRALVTKTVDDTGALAPNALSRGMATVRDSTGIGQAIDQRFGGRARWVSRQSDQLAGQIQAVLGDMQAPADQVEAAARDSVKLVEDYKDWPAEKMADLTRRLELGDYDGLGGEELAFIGKARDLNARYAGHLIDDGDAAMVNGEVYAGATAKRLNKRIRDRDQAAEMAFARQQVTTPTLDPLDYARAARRWAGADMSRADKWIRVRTAVEALDTAGHNVSDLRTLVNKAQRGGTWTDLQQALDGTIDQLEQGGRLPELTRSQRASIGRAKRRDTFVRDQLGRYSDKSAAWAARKADVALGRAVPARFEPLAQDTIRRRLTEDLQGRLANTAEEAEQIAAAVAERRWRAIPGWDSEAERAYRGIEKDVRSTWMEMRDAGIDPVFVHTVTPGKVGQTAFPTVGATKPGLTQARARSGVAAAGVRDVTVSLSHQGVEFLRRRAAGQLDDLVTQKYGMTEAELRESMLPAAQARAQIQPLLDVEGHLRRQLTRGWVKTGAGDQARWIPRTVAKTLEQLSTPSGGSLAGAVMDPFTRTFRTAVIGLSPRTQLYNVLGGATMTLAKTGPSIAKYAEDAWKMARDPSLIPDAELRTLMGAQKRNLETLGRRARIGEAAVPGEGALAFLGGRTMRRLWDQAQQAKTTAAPVTERLGQLTDLSMEWNAKIDNFYRAATYLYGEGKGLKRGLSPEDATRAGVELARKTLADWSSMTPFERGIARTLLPFYGFQSHVIRYVANFPLDHPLRAEIMGKIGQAEVDDLNDTLPTRMLGTLFLGGQGSGKHTGINLAAVNPFGDVANMMTMAGFLGSTNPVIQAALESVGVDFGTAELYPTLRYDPESGRMQGVHRGFLGALAGNVIPQTQIATALLGASGEFQERMRLDPSSAWRQLASAGGIPVVWKQYDLGAERIKTEVTRQKSEHDVLNDALSSGDWTEALRYPSLRDAYAAISAAPAEQLPRPVPVAQARTLASTTGGI